MTNTGRWVYGLLIGAVVVLIRVTNSTHPDGVMFAILFGNILAPLIDYVVMYANIRRRMRAQCLTTAIRRCARTGASLVRRLRDMPNDSPAKAVIVTLLVCIFASVLVAGSAVLLRPKQIANKQFEQIAADRRNFAGRHRNGDAWRAIDIADLEARVVELATGNYVDGD